MIFNLKDGVGVDFIGFEGKLMQEGSADRHKLRFTTHIAASWVTYSNLTLQIRSCREYL